MAWFDTQPQDVTPSSDPYGNKALIDKQDPEVWQYLPQGVQSAILADKDFAAKWDWSKGLSDEFDDSTLQGLDLSSEGFGHSGKHVQSGYGSAANPLPGGGITGHGSANQYQPLNSGLLGDGDFRFRDGWKQPVLSQAVYDPKYGLMLPGAVANPWRKTKGSFLYDTVVPAATMATISWGAGAGFSSVLNGSTFGQAIGSTATKAVGQGLGSSTTTLASGGSPKDALISGVSGGAGSFAGQSVAGSIGGSTGRVAGAASGAATSAAINTAAHGGSFSDILTSAGWGALASGTGAGVAETVGSPVAGSVTGGLINAAKPINTPNQSTQPQTNTATTAKKPVAIQSLSWGWLAPSR